MDLIFARHGNTFGPDDKVVWVGRETDLELVARGREQAMEVARALADAKLVPTRVVSGTLRRTRGFAGLVVEALAPGLAIDADPRLDEIDYGAWAGRSSPEIAALPGQAEAMRAWQDADVWPTTAGWRSAEAEILGAIKSVLADLLTLDGGPVLVVSSNGTLRFAPRLLGLAEPGRSYQMKTGHLGLVRRAEDGGLTLLGWNLPPNDVSTRAIPSPSD